MKFHVLVDFKRLTPFNEPEGVVEKKKSHFLFDGNNIREQLDLDK
jgi:hypothetical protein